jgi:hypothetical protein
VSVALGAALLLVSGGAIVLLGLVGRRLVRNEAGVPAAGLVAAVALGYAVVPFAAAFLARGTLALPVDLTIGANVLEVDVSPAPAFLLPLAIAAAAATTGALSAGAASAPPGDAAISGVVLGGVRAFGLALLLSVVGVLVLASLQPSFARAYGSVITAPDSVRGRLVVGGHAVLLLPNQAMWVLVPAMGACDEAVVDGRGTPFLCYWRSPADLPGAFAVDAGYVPRTPALRPPPRAYLAFLLVPLLATIGGGFRAARRAASIGGRAASGAASGVVFAALVAVGVVLSRVDLEATGALFGASTLRLSLGPELVRGTALAAAWGIAGGAVGGVAARYVGGTGTSSA